MRKPNLFLVGPPKCGTSAMHDFLRQHPDIFMSPEKEPQFFVSGSEGTKLRRAQKSLYHKLDEYLGLFRGAKEEKLVGEASTWYFPFESVPARIKEFSPDAKILVMVRRPETRLKSLYYFFVNYFFYESREKGYPAFEKKYFLDEDGKAEDYLLFAPHLKRYYGVFGKSMGVVLFEEFKENNLSTMRKVYRFLGVDPEFVPRTREINVSGEPRNPLSALAMNAISLSLGALRALGVSRFLREQPPSSLFGRLRRKGVVAMRDSKKSLLSSRKPGISTGPGLKKELDKDWEDALEFCREKDILI